MAELREAHLRYLLAIYELGKSNPDVGTQAVAKALNCNMVEIEVEATVYGSPPQAGTGDTGPGRPARHITAHRMRTVENANKIVVLSGGTVAETGTPAELMKRNGAFARMVKLQTESQNWMLA